MSRVIVLATPVFFALIALEYAWGRRHGRDTYRLADAVSSISLGIMSQYTAVFTRLLRVGIYVAVFGSLSLVTPQAGEAFWTSWYGWVLALVFYDLCYYWHHRLGHEVAVFWAAHVVHHQSQDYNLSTALRQTSSGALLGWVFYVPMALAGVPPKVFAVVALVDLLYQFWVHTEHVGRLGWFDRWFVSPSNHRVHHAINDGYLDRNYGGIWIVWDRLFGTFVEEGERCVYGTKKPLDSWDPLWANVEVYAELGRAARATPRWPDKLRVFLARPGWRAPGVPAPARVDDAARAGKFEIPVPRAAQWSGALLFVLALAATTGFLWYADGLRAGVLWVGALGLTALLWLANALLQGRLPVLLGWAGVAAVGATVGQALSGEGVGGVDWLAVHRACKPLVMALAATWAWRAGASAWLVGALLASMAGDVALMFPGGFLAGLGSFLLAHLMYLMLFSRTVGRRAVGWLPRRGPLLWVAAYGLAMGAVLWPHLPAGLRVPVAVYVAVICLMGAQALGRASVLRDGAARTVAAGAVLFMTSDTLLAVNRFVAPLPLAALWVLSTYFAGQLLIARFAAPSAADDPPGNARAAG
jgi:sterol desaturase/sphingolipid hydroxylase (fatty acid hydroxylase superfamily)/uncharacterized membrane protein YhhN